MADLSKSIPALLEHVFDVADSGETVTVIADAFVPETVPDIDTSELDGSATTAELETIVQDIVDALEAIGLVTETSA